MFFIGDGISLESLIVFLLTLNLTFLTEVTAQHKNMLIYYRYCHNYFLSGNQNVSVLSLDS